MASSANPELREAQMAAEARAHSAEAVRRERLPGLGIEGKFEYGRAPGRDRQDNPLVYDSFNVRSLNAAFGLRWDLSFKQNAAKVAREEAEAQAARARRDAVATRLRLELGRLQARLDEARSVYETSRRALSTTANWLRVADENHALGTASTNDVVDSYTAYVQARVAHVRGHPRAEPRAAGMAARPGAGAARRRRSPMKHRSSPRARVCRAPRRFDPGRRPADASSGPLVDALKARQARIDSILSAHPGKLAGPARQTLEEALAGAIDFDEMARGALAAWASRSAAERAAYAAAFQKLIRRSLMRRVDIYRIEGVDYAAEAVQGDHGRVDTVVRAKDVTTEVAWEFVRTPSRLAGLRLLDRRRLHGAQLPEAVRPAARNQGVERPPRTDQHARGGDRSRDREGGLMRVLGPRSTTARGTHRRESTAGRGRARGDDRLRRRGGARAGVRPHAARAEPASAGADRGPGSDGRLAEPARAGGGEPAPLVARLHGGPDRAPRRRRASAVRHGSRSCASSRGSGRCSTCPPRIVCDTRLFEKLLSARESTALVDSAPPESPPAADGRRRAHVERTGLRPVPAGAGLAGVVAGERDGRTGLARGDRARRRAAARCRRPGRVRRLLAPDPAAAVVPRPAPEHARAAEAALVDTAQKGALDVPAIVHGPIESAIVARVCWTPVTPNQLTVFAAAVAWTATALFASGHLGAGLPSPWRSESSTASTASWPA